MVSLLLFTKKPKKDKPTTSKAKTVKPESKSVTDSKIAELHQKWSDRFNRLEALLMARTLEPTFSTVKVTPTHSPPAGAVKNTEPFMKPTQSATASSEFPGSDSSAVKHQSTSETKTHRPRSSEHTGTDSSAAKHQSTIQLTHRPGSSSSERTGTDFSAVKHQSTSKLQSSRPHTDQPSDPTGTDSLTLHRSRKDSISSLSSEAVSEVSDQPPLDLYVEEGELSEDQDITVTDQDQSISEEQTYRETMRGIHSFMGWLHVPDMDSSTNTSNDNPFA